VLTHGTEKVPYMKPAGWLYARKYPQANLYIKSWKNSITNKKQQVSKITKSGHNVKNLELRILALGPRVTEAKNIKADNHPESSRTPCAMTQAQARI
jgi:hypothetical protein